MKEESLKFLGKEMLGMEDRIVPMNGEKDKHKEKVIQKSGIQGKTV